MNEKISEKCCGCNEEGTEGNRLSSLVCYQEGHNFCQKCFNKGLDTAVD